MIPYNTIQTVSTSDFFQEFELSEEVLDDIRELLEEGFTQETIDIIVNEYLIPASDKYSGVMTDYLDEMDDGPLRDRELDKLTRNISVLSIAFAGYLSGIFNKYVRSGYMDTVFEGAGISDRELKKTIYNEVIQEFERLTSNTISQTQGFVVNSIRNLQREMISENLLLKNSKIEGDILEQEINRFKQSLRIKYPSIYKAINNKNILTTISFRDGEEITRHYKLDYYVDLVARTTLLNVDRTTNIVSALVNDEPVVEFYLADPRNVKKDRELCQEILANKVNGLSILALNDDVATKLGILTYDEAKSTPDYSFGPYCRHSVRRCSKEYIKSLEGILNGN